MKTILGSGNYTYEEDLDWAKLPAGWSFLEVTDVAVDSHDRVFVFNRGQHPMIVFDREGNFLFSWGEGQFSKKPHGVTIGPDDILYCVDDGGHTVRKYTPEGKLIMTIGTQGQAAPYQSGIPFNRPTKVALDPKSDEFYVSDGYGNSRVHKYSADGILLFSWGAPGTDPGEFNIVHTVCTDRDGWVYVTDRESHRLQIFDARGKYITQWNNMHRVCGLCLNYEPDLVVYVTEMVSHQNVNKDIPNLGSRISIFDSTGRRIGRLGGLHAGEGPGEFISPHSLAIDSRGDLYVGEVSFNALGRKLTPPRELRSFRKLIRQRGGH